MAHPTPLTGYHLLLRSRLMPPVGLHGIIAEDMMACLLALPRDPAGRIDRSEHMTRTSGPMAVRARRWTRFC